jgi:hypothetical protein
MKAVLFAAIFTLVTGVARADWAPQWGKLKVGMDVQSARACVGMPLLRNHGRGGNETWTYDECGYVQLRFGRVTYWEAPKPIAQQMAQAAAIAKVTGTDKPVAGKTKRLPNAVAVRD